MVSLSLPPIALGTGAIIAILIFAGVSIATVIAFITKNIGVILILLVFLVFD